VSQPGDCGHLTGNDEAAWRTIAGQSKYRDTVGSWLERGLPPDKLRAIAVTDRTRMQHGQAVDMAAVAD
jgi:hypothetical protein